MRTLIAIFVISLYTAPAFSEVPVHAGTAFFVTPDSLITNEHVVHGGCSQIFLQENGRDWATARIIAIDAEHDLALLRSQPWPYDHVVLRKDIETLQVGNNVAMVGYPADASIGVRYEVSAAKVINAHASFGDPHMLQFSDAIKQGYSGGPLLDDSGKVVGVVKGMAERYEVSVSGEKKLVEKIDEAVNLVTLEEFLAAQGVYFQAADYVDKRRSGVRFIVNVQCVDKGHE